jgi:hypothetical protein
MAVIAASVSLGGGASNVWQIFRDSGAFHFERGEFRFRQHRAIPVQQFVERGQPPAWRSDDLQRAAEIEHLLDSGGRR